MKLTKQEIERLRINYFCVDEKTLIDKHGRPYIRTQYGFIYLSVKQKYYYEIKN